MYWLGTVKGRVVISKISPALAATAIMLASGCIAIPARQANPFNDDLLAFIVPGPTDRAAVAAHRGTADITRTHPALDVYHTSRSTAIQVIQVAIEALASSHLSFKLLPI